MAPSAQSAQISAASSATSSATADEIAHLQQHGLYAGSQEHDACGVGFVAHIKGTKTHAIVGQALKILENLDTAARSVPTRSWATALAS